MSILRFLAGFGTSRGNRARLGRAPRRLALEVLESRLNPTAAANQVVNLYQDFLNRVPEEPAQSMWVQALESGTMTVGQMAGGILHSHESAVLRVIADYQEYLDRLPDSEGLDSHVTALQNGVPQFRVTAAILAADEYFARHGAANIPFVESLYTTVLHRDFDQAGLEAYVAALARGVSRADVALAFLTSIEHGRQLAGDAYRDLLNREGSAEELDAWAAVMAGAVDGYFTLQVGVTGAVEGTAALALPAVVQNLAVSTVGVGIAQLAWSPPAGDSVTSYSVTVNGGTSTTTTATSMPFSGLDWQNTYTFSVAATNASGTGQATQTVLQGPQTITVGNQPRGLTTGQDGSIWVANYNSDTVQQITNNAGVWTAEMAISVGTKPEGLTTGQDGSIWVANSGDNTVQEIRNTAGVWTAETAISVGTNPEDLTTGQDGSIWVSEATDNTVPPSPIDATDNTMPPSPVTDVLIRPGTSGTEATVNSVNPTPVFELQAQAQSDTVQQITNTGGVWTAQTAISVGGYPQGLTTGQDGSIWVANTNTVQQITNTGGTTVWTAQPAIEVGVSPFALTTGLDGSILVSNVTPSANVGTVQQIRNSGGVWTAQTPISVGSNPQGLTTGQDGSIWVATTISNTVQEIWYTPTPPLDPVAVPGPGAGEMTLAWTAVPDGGSPVLFYTVTVYQGTATQTIMTSSTSTTFSGLVFGQGNTYFTVNATYFVGTSQAASLLVGPDGNLIDTINKGVGIVTDGTPFTGGGFDGDGNAYSWEALGSSPTLGWNGVTFDLGTPNQPDFTWAAGQTILVPQGGFNMLNLAGAAVNGSQQNQQIGVNYSDGTSAVWTQSFSDWGSPQNYGHESVISTQSYRDTASGSTPLFTNRIYGYSLAIPAGKTLVSITLPTNANVRFLDLQMSTSTPVDLSNSYTSWGIAIGGPQVNNHEGFDGDGDYYYSGDLQSTIAWSGANFNFGPVPTKSSAENNFVQGKGQTIPVPYGNFSGLYLAGAGNGNQESQTFIMNFSDGSTAKWTQSFSVWLSPSYYAGESIIQQQANWVNQAGYIRVQTNYVYGYAYQIPAGKTLVSVQLPNNSNVGILGMAMV